MHIPTSWTIRAMSRSNPVFRQWWQPYIFRAFAQHPVRKQSLQFLRLLPASPGKKHIYAYYFLFTRINNSQRNAVWQRHSNGRKYTKIFRVCISGCIVRSIRLDSILQKIFCPFQVLWSIDSNSFHLTDTDLYLYPFSSQRSCSKDSANSKEDCGSMVISFSTSVRYAYNPMCL